MKKTPLLAGLLIAKNEAMVKITLPENNEQSFTPRYQLYLPPEDELRKEFVAKREEVERGCRLRNGV
jgi:hypothetical protein